MRIYSHRCEVCGFDFDKFYGKDFADGYIEMHYIESNFTTREGNVNPTVDLIPVCANCHKMLHYKGNTLTVEELKERIKNRF